MAIRTINTKEFTNEYDKRVGTQDFLQEVRKMTIGSTIGISADSKVEAQRKRHGVINDAHRRRKAGQNAKYQTVVKENEVWVRRIE